jgi:hypothetical protein
MKRRLFQIAAVVCLLCCGATLALWARGRMAWVGGPVGTAWASYFAAGSNGVSFLLIHQENLECNRWVGWTFAAGPEPDSMEYYWAGFGCSLGEKPIMLEAGGRKVGWRVRKGYDVCVPPWFLAILFLLLAYVFSRKSRRKLNTGHGFSVLPTPPEPH